MIVIGVTLVMAVAHIVVPEPATENYLFIENLLPVIIDLSVLSLTLAWRWEPAGGAINVGLFVLDLGPYWIIRGKPFSLRALPVFSAVIVLGLLLLVCW
jgi:hypothetical protein